MLVVLYGPQGWLGRWLEPAGVRVVYAVAGHGAGDACS